MQWKTEEIKKLAEEAAFSVDDSKFVIKTRHPRGDVDTTAVWIDLANHTDAIIVCGFHTEQDITNPDDAEVEMIEIRSFHSDSKGGITTDSEELVIAAHRLTQKLKNLGWIIIPNMDAYF